MKQPLKWLPLYVDPWLFGSTRHELTREQRSDFVDLLLLAAKDSGFIRANEKTPYPVAQLSGLLCIETAALEETIARCIEVGKLERRENGTLYVVNWERYKLTPQYRRRLESGQEEKAEIEEKKRGEESKRERNSVSQKRNTVSQKRTSPPPTSEEQTSEVDEDGLLPIPKNLPFKVRDELVERKGDICRLLRLLSRGVNQDGESRISVEGVERRKREFNDRVRDFTLKGQSA
jgi:hypothetical protein